MGGRPADGSIKEAVPRSLPLVVAVLVLQLVAAAYFIFDGVMDVWASAGHGQAFSNLMELVVALALAGGIIVAAGYTRALMHEARKNAHTLAIARGALSDLLDMRFAEWGLSPGETEVALFAIKGLAVTDIARIRGAATGTVRSQLSQVYTKAGVSSQSMLVSLFIEDLMPA